MREMKQGDYFTHTHTHTHHRSIAEFVSESHSNSEPYEHLLKEGIQNMRLEEGETAVCGRYIIQQAFLLIGAASPERSRTRSSLGSEALIYLRHIINGAGLRL